MRIATWNVNSVRARTPNVLEWMQSAKPDVLLLQEIKCETEAFPKLEFESAGYQVRALGQKTYNGVALLSRQAITDIQTDIEGYVDPQRRILMATVGDFRVISGVTVGTAGFLRCLFLPIMTGIHGV